jgi:hypothetical protein
MIRVLLLFAAAAPAFAGLVITTSADDIVPRAANHPTVIAQHLGADPSGTTSLRFQSEKTVDQNQYPTTPGINNNRVAPPTQTRVQNRDRDLGQTFLTGSRPVKLDAIYLRFGFTPRAVLSGARGARVALQIMEVTGTPRLNDSGTPGFVGKFDRATSPELDDFIEGETYKHVHVATGGIIPENAAPGHYMKWDLTGADEITLQPNRHYAFVVMFMDRGKERSMSLANSYYGSYRPDPSNSLAGHGIRREGGSGPAEPPYFSPDLPDNFKKRLRQAPSTIGFPDVCTFRDLFFTITAVPK